jgi:hypothetical protein
MLLVAALIGSAVVVASMPAEAASTSGIVYHANGRVAGEVWFNSGYSAIHDGKPQFGENTFTVKDRFCGDGWGIGVEWVLNGKSYSRRVTGDCRHDDITFQANPNQPIATRFSWRPFKWDTNHISATTHEPWRSDWMGSDKDCRHSLWMGRAATYGYVASGVGYTFEVSIWPTATARSVGRLDSDRAASSMWTDLKQCTPLPRKLTRDQRESMYNQLLCHIFYAISPSKYNGGNTWDLEAERPNISRLKALNPAKTCNW